MKYDENKLMYHLIPYEILESLAEIFTYGYKKYANDEKETKWREVEIERYESAMFRHYISWKKGEDYDKESNLHHLKHMLWNISVILYLSIKKQK